MCRIVWTRIDTARLRMVVAEIARCSFLHRRLLTDASCRSRELVEVDVSIRTVIGTESASHAPVFNNHFKGIAAANRSHGTADHAEGIAALAARGGDQIILEAQAITNEPRNAVVRVSAGFHTLIAARAAIKIEDQQTLRVHQALLQEVVDWHTLQVVHAAAIFFDAL